MAACAEEDEMYSQLKKRQRDLQTKVARYDLHLKQYEQCRSEVKLAEEALSFNDGKYVLYRDFVNCYNEAGQKCKNLVLVKVTRGENGELVAEKLHNFSTDKRSGCDAYFVADVFEHHLKPRSKGGSGCLEDIKHITLSGDHGPHFSNIQTLWNESTFFSKYGKTVHLKFLCSYHAYNRCDGAGVCVKKEAEHAARNNCGPLSAEQYTTLMNTSHNSDTYAFTFSTINRGVDVFPKKMKKMVGVRKFCDLTFIHADQNGEMSARTEGVVRARLVPGQGVYTVFDLLPRPAEWGRLCQVCTSAKQRPVYHTREKTKCDATLRAVQRAAQNSKRRKALPQPDCKRISGPQVARKRKAMDMDRKSVIPEMKMVVKDIKAELLALGVSASLLVGKLKPALAALLASKRSEHGQRKKQKRKPDSEEDDAEEEANEDEEEREDEEEDEEEEEMTLDAILEDAELQPVAPTALDATLQGRGVVVKWGGVGWARGVVTEHFARGTRGKFNYEIKYDDGYVDHLLEVCDYATANDVPTGSWALLV